MDDSEARQPARQNLSQKHAGRRMSVTPDRAGFLSSRMSQEQWTRGIGLVLVAGYLFVTFVGIGAISGSASVEQRVEGSMPQRIVLVSLLLLALTLIWKQSSTALVALRDNKATLGIILFCVFSAIWSDYPNLTIRRAIVLAATTVIAMGVALGPFQMRKSHTAIFFGLTGIVVLNLAIVFLWPSWGMSHDGAKGLYSEKNSAGQVGMIAVIITAAWITGTRNYRARAVGCLALAASFLFLVLSKSKTSIGITVMALFAGVVLVLCDRLGRRFKLLVWSVFLLVLAASIVVLFSNEFNLTRSLGMFVNDTSFSSRDAIWNFAWDKARDRIWLGHGYGAFWDVGAVNDPLTRVDPGFWLGDVDTGVINEAHNGYLDLFLGIGLPAAIIATITVLSGMITDARNFLSPAVKRPAKAAYLAFFLISMAYLVHNVTESTLFTRGVPLFNTVILCRFLGSAERASRQKLFS